MTLVIEFFTTVLGHQLEEPMLDINYFNPYSGPTILDPKRVPTHYTTEGGGSYSARPDLSRPSGPGAYYALGIGSMAILTLYTTAVIHQSYASVIEDEEEHVQRSLWRSFAQALTGGPGVGSWSY